MQTAKILNLRPKAAAPDASASWMSPLCNLEAEQALLGTVLYDNGAVVHAEGVKAAHFFEPFHGRLWQVIVDSVAAGRLAEPITLANRFSADPAFADLGGVRYFADLVDRAPPSSHVADYGALISDLSVRRDLISAADALAAQAADIASGETAEAVIANAERGLADIARGSAGADSWESAFDVSTQAVRGAMDRQGRIDLSTGLTDLDALTGGFRRGEMAVIAGRPAMGKSTAGLAVAKAFAQRGQGVCFFSMEMARVALGLRMACDLAFDRDRPATRIPYFHADRGQLHDTQWRDLDDSAESMRGWPLAFDTRPGQTPAQMEAKARRQFRKWEAAGIERGCVVVDHLTIAATDNARSGNKVAEIGDISRGLAEMAKRLDVPVIALCQLSRDVEKRDAKDRRPSLSDLRWSGEIEQDARLVMFLYRPEYYVRPPADSSDAKADVAYHDALADTQNKLLWIVAKNNNGPVGEVETFCDMACSAIRDRAA